MIMKVIMRLYRRHDLDLVYLYKMNDASFPQTVKKALKAYISGQDAAIQVHPNQSTISASTLPQRIQFHLTLSEKNDAEIIKFITSISLGYRNSAIKNIIRCFLTSPIIAPYSNFEYGHSGSQKNHQTTVNSNIQLSKSNPPASMPDALRSQLIQPHNNKVASKKTYIAETTQNTLSGNESPNFLDTFFSLADEN